MIAHLSQRYQKLPHEVYEQYTGEQLSIYEGYLLDIELTNLIVLEEKVASGQESTSAEEEIKMREIRAKKERERFQ